MNYVSYALFSVLLGGLGQVLWKIGLNTVNLNLQDLSKLKDTLMNEWILAGILCYVISTLLWWKALKDGPISQVYPFTSINFIILVVVGYFLFKENLGFLGIIGITLIVTGIICLAYSYSV